MHTQRRQLCVILMVVALAARAALPAAAGLFEWSRLGRLIPEQGFEPSLSAIAGDPGKAAVLYAGTLRSTANNNLVFKSSDGGVSWQPAGSGLPAVMPQNTGINDLVIPAGAPNTLYAGLFEAGVWQSTNGGQQWANVTNGSIATNDTVRALALDPAQATTVYALTGTGAHVSAGGGAWQSRSAGLPGASSTLYNDFAADPLHAGTLYVATNPQGLFRSTNGGQSWQPANDGLPAGDLNVKGIAASPVNGRVLISVAGQGLWRSDNQGGSWTRSDSGISYNTTLQGSVGIPAFSPSVSGAAYVSNNDGVFASSNGGESWTPFNDGFSGAETVLTMAFHSAAPDTVYAGTAVSGVWSLMVIPGGRNYLPAVIR